MPDRGSGSSFGQECAGRGERKRLFQDRFLEDGKAFYGREKQEYEVKESIIRHSGGCDGV